MKVAKHPFQEGSNSWTCKVCEGVPSSPLHCNVPLPIEQPDERGLHATPRPWETSGHVKSYGDPKGWAIRKHLFFDEGDLEDEWGIYPPLGEYGPVALVNGRANAELIVAAVNAYNLAAPVQGDGRELNVCDFRPRNPEEPCGICSKPFLDHRIARRSPDVGGEAEHGALTLHKRESNARICELEGVIRDLLSVVDAEVTTDHDKWIYEREIAAARVVIGQPSSGKVASPQTLNAENALAPEPESPVETKPTPLDGNLIEDIEVYRRAKEKMGHVEDKMLLWCLKGTVLLDVPMFSYQSALIDELEDRLFPEYDGDKVKLEDFGWRTPDGLIIYSDAFCTEDHSDSKAAELERVNLEPYDCCRKCPHCFRHFKRRYYLGHPETCSRNPPTQPPATATVPSATLPDHGPVSLLYDLCTVGDHSRHSDSGYCERELEPTSSRVIDCECSAPASSTPTPAAEQMKAAILGRVDNLLGYEQVGGLKRIIMAEIANTKVEG